jgi:hypothetical protein
MELPGYESEKPQTYMKGVKSRAIVLMGLHRPAMTSEVSEHRKLKLPSRSKPLETLENNYRSTGIWLLSVLGDINFMFFPLS